jgi:uncharacterized membrane protein
MSSPTQKDINKELEVGLFKTPDDARRAQKAIDAWDQAVDSVKLGGSAVVFKDPTTGKVNSERSGSLNWMRNIGLNSYIGLIGGGKDIPLIGGIGGAISSWLSGVDEQQTIQHVNAALGRGQAALAILCDSYEKPAVEDQLQRLGAEVTGLKVPSHVVTQVDSAVQAAAAQGQITQDTTTASWQG